MAPTASRSASASAAGTERNRPRAAMLARVDDERLRRAVPVLGPVAHQLAGSQTGERQDATTDGCGGRSRPRLPLILALPWSDMATRMRWTTS